jgi:hypothetical protein
VPHLHAGIRLASGRRLRPDAFAELWGYPAKADSSAASRDVPSAAHLWEVSVVHPTITVEGTLNRERQEGEKHVFEGNEDGGVVRVVR